MTDLKIISQNKKIYGPYDHHITCDLFCDPAEDKTKQSFGDECNINTILAKYAKTGIFDSGNSTPPVYGVASAFDFQQALNVIISAEFLFNSLPSGVRSKFDNDPHTMLAWMDNPLNVVEATSMGLLRAAEGVSGGSIPLTPEVANTPHTTPM